MSIHDFFEKLKIHYTEAVCLSVMIITLLIGVIIHFFSHSHDCMRCNDEQVSFCLAVLQIHATVITLALTIITLVTGFSYTVYGISASDFFINRKPVILTQKNVVISSIFLLCLNVIMNYTGFMQCIVLYMFLASASLIIYSANEIYPVFKGIHYVRLEIRNWLKNTIKTCKDNSMVINLFETFMADWQEHKNQTSQEYEDYLEIYSTAINRILVQ